MQAPPASDRRSAWSALLANPPVLFLCTQQFFRAAGAVFWFTWCPTYLQNTFGLDPVEAGSLTSLPIIGIVVGSITGGLIADRILLHTGSRRQSRAGTAIVATLLGVVFFALTFAVPPTNPSWPSPCSCSPPSAQPAAIRARTVRPWTWVVATLPRSSGR